MPSNDPRKPGDETEPGTPQSGDNVCPRCGGSGKQGDDRCAACEGTGTVTTLVGDA